MLRLLLRRPQCKGITRCVASTSSQAIRGLASTFDSTPAQAAKKYDGPASHGHRSVDHDDKLLRDIFDAPQTWPLATATHIAPAGLFQNKHLTSPAGFQQYAQRTLGKAQALVARIAAAHEPEQLRRMVKDLDRLSDLLCRVIDMSDFVRATHPDREFVAAANAAYGVMYEYMNVLNTTTELYDALRRALASAETVASWSAEEAAVAGILLRDFEKCGINLPGEARRKFVRLSSEIAELGPAFVNGMAPRQPYLTFRSSQLAGMDPMVVRQLARGGRVTIPTVGMAAAHALRTAEDPEIRRELYVAGHTASDRQLDLLAQLLSKRAELAGVVGHASYAAVALSDKMARTPEAVQTFLRSLGTANKPYALAELDTLTSLKQSHGRTDPLQIWDREFYASKHLQALRTASAHRARAPDSLSAYFSLGTVMQGLSRLFTRLYGVRFVPRSTPPGETWHPDVRRLDVVCETDGPIAVVYCDLFERPGKNPNPAHFTVRCSRVIADDEYLHDSADGLGRGDDGMASARSPSDGELYQLPTIALICDFTRSSPNSTSKPRPPLLSFREVQTLFHEMGHALHSMLGRTKLHNVAGTRCATDFAELPSVLMEHFARSPEVLSLFARHYESDAPLPQGLLAARLEQESIWDATETQAQIILAMLDQEYHTLPPPSSSSSSANQISPDKTTQIFRRIEGEWDTLPPVQGTSWQGFFGHLFGYGATYYSYLFDRAIAARVWKVVFERDPVDGEAGARYRSEVLRWGGGREGWECVAGVLGDERLRSGGVEAMGEVGRWGCERKVGGEL
ncbi:hypothetical protein DFH27DRAFT_625050 [Peziza echinospora]|nr:hypothetical protein DFH27DRAFT_625050 [Peziza echinospora]